MAFDGPLLFFYLDDGISRLLERVSAFAVSWVHQMDLKFCGLKLKKEKSKLEPMQVRQWLGFVIDTIAMQFRVPPKKIAKLKSNLDFIISSQTVTFRDLARSHQVVILYFGNFTGAVWQHVSHLVSWYLHCAVLSDVCCEM